MLMIMLIQNAIQVEEIDPLLSIRLSIEIYKVLLIQIYEFLIKLF